ncbi:MAG: MBOAT family protein [Clostridia bacterium]|nr:MBOAT family protein [Clostridia bacterium]
MLFSSVNFLYYFLPAVILIYFLAPKKLKNLVLLAASLFFYFYGEPIYVLLMIFTCLSGYIHGILIEKAKNTKYSKVPLISSIIISLGLLAFFKYSDFFLSTVNGVFGSHISLLGIALPIGISFYTFQVLSYTIDVYNLKVAAQKNILKFSTYISLFPQLIAGPIVRYSTIEKSLTERKTTLEDFAKGATRFVIGLGKKIIIANSLAELANSIQSMPTQTVLGYWILAIAFMFQAYFDFSGYSDMAIGLGKIFGFDFLENFQYPFISKSISEFWRRWHMSLGQWFRDYVYIPMGGSRVGKFRWVLNVLVVWLLTGLWHGANWNFVIWGLYLAIFLILEKFIYGKYLEKTPSIIRTLTTFIILMFSFIIFNSESVSQIIVNIGGMFGAGKIAATSTETIYYLISYLALIIMAFIGSTPIIKNLVEKIKSNAKGEKTLNFLQPVFIAVVMLLCTGYLIDGSFNPFLYFRF